MAINSQGLFVGKSEIQVSASKNERLRLVNECAVEHLMKEDFEVFNNICYGQV
jgi:hypothetical protein